MKARFCHPSMIFFASASRISIPTWDISNHWWTYCTGPCSSNRQGGFSKRSRATLGVVGISISKRAGTFHCFYLNCLSAMTLVDSNMSVPPGPLATHNSVLERENCNKTFNIPHFPSHLPSESQRSPVSSHRGPFMFGDTSPRLLEAKAATNEDWPGGLTDMSKSKKRVLASQFRGAHQLLHHEACSALVIPWDQFVGLVHRGWVHGEPVEDPNWIVFRIMEVELDHLGVHIGGISAKITPFLLSTTRPLFTWLVLPLDLHCSWLGFCWC